MRFLSERGRQWLAVALTVLAAVAMALLCRPLP